MFSFKNSAWFWGMRTPTTPDVYREKYQSEVFWGDAALFVPSFFNK
jgi:hypothetical protein